MANVCRCLNAVFQEDAKYTTAIFFILCNIGVFFDILDCVKTFLCQITNRVLNAFTLENEVSCPFFIFKYFSVSIQMVIEI